MPDLPPPSSGNADVCAATALGWQVADLFHPHGPGSDPKPGSLLPERSDFSAATQAKWLAQEIGPQIMALLPGQFSQEPPTDLQEMLTAVETAATATPQVDLGQAVFKLHEQLLDDLGTADIRLGKAYSLGQTLSEVALTAASNSAEFRESFQDGRVTMAKAWLFDLKALLPDHTAYAVNSGLDDWARWVDGTQDLAPEQGAARTQGRIWRELLTGEKAATDILGEADYQAAAWQVARRVLRRYWWLIALGLVVAVGLVVIMAEVQSLSPEVRLFSCIGTAATTLGISLGGTGALLGNALKDVGGWLWQAELDEAVAIAAITLPAPDAHRRAKREEIGRLRLKSPAGNAARHAAALALPAAAAVGLADRGRPGRIAICGYSPEGPLFRCELPGGS